MRGTISYPASTNAPAPSTRWLTDLDLAAATASLATTSDLAAVASDLQSTSNSLAASINDVQAYSETNRTDKLWSSGTSYMDGDGVMWEIISRPYNTLTCVQADAHPELLGGVWSEAIHPIWPAPGFFPAGQTSGIPLLCLMAIGIQQIGANGISRSNISAIYYLLMLMATQLTKILLKCLK